MPFCQQPWRGRRPVDKSLVFIETKGGGRSFLRSFSNSVLSSEGTTEGAVINHVPHTNAS